MQTDQPDVSVIIAAYEATDFIATAVQSALSQQGASIEVIVAPDDGNDYRFLSAFDRHVKVLEPLPSGVKPTGPAAARNRALASASGKFIALLDADDYWSPTYLQLLLPLAAAHGLAYGRTAIADWHGIERRSIPNQKALDRVDYNHFATAFGSLHAVVKSDPKRVWHNVLAEDVLFDIESLALAGGTAPYVEDAVYWLRIRPQSVTHSADFIKGIDAGYADIIDRIRCGKTMIPAGEAAAVTAVFQAWRDMNACFTREYASNPTLEFHAYVADLAARSAG